MLLVNKALEFFGKLGAMIKSWSTNRTGFECREVFISMQLRSDVGLSLILRQSINVSLASPLHGQMLVELKCLRFWLSLGAQRVS